MKNIFPILFTLVLIACNNNTVEVKTYPNTENTPNIEEKDGKTTLNNSFHKAFLYKKGEEIQKQILKIAQKETLNEMSLFSDSEMHIESTKNKWKANVKAHELNIKNSTLEAKYKADYEHEDTYALFNIETGEHLINYTYNCLTARIPESNFKRYIGFTAKTNATGLLAKADEDVLGIITYASDEKTIQQFFLKTTKKINQTTPSMELVSLNENQSVYDNGSLLYFMDLTSDYTTEDINFAFGFTFYEGEMAEETAILFEIKDDEINLKDARYDKEVFEIEAF